MDLEHPDITCAQRYGYARNQSPENLDSPESRLKYVEDSLDELFAWLKLGYPEILDEFVEHNEWDYRSWLN